MSQPPDRQGAGAARGDSGLERGPFLLHRNKGREHFQAQEYALARRHLELALSIRPDDEEVMYWLAMTYFRLDQHPEAEALFRRLLDARPGVASLHVNRGIVLYKMNRVDEAETEFRRALDLDGRGNRAHLYLGLLEARRGDYRAALDRFQRAGAEVLAARMKLRMRTSKPRWSGARMTPPPRTLDDDDDPFSQPARVPPVARTAAPAPAAAAPAPADHPEAAAAGGEARFRRRGRYLVEVDFREQLLVRNGAVAACAGELRFEPVTGEEDLLRVHGSGRLVLVGQGRRLSVVELAGDAPFLLEIGRFVACERRLRCELVSLGRRDGPGMRVVALHGAGIVAIASGGPPVAIEVRPDRPVSVAADLVVGWSGEIQPSLLRQGGMDDHAICGAVGDLKLRLHGRGRVLIDHRREAGP